MILFWVICALCIVIALAFVLPTLLDQKSEAVREGDFERRNANIAVYRDQLGELATDLQNGIISSNQYEQDREEIERRLLEDTSATASKTKALPLTSDRRTAYVLGLGIPLVAVILYYNIGQPAVISASATAAPGSVSQPGGPRTQEQIEANVSALAKRLQANPNDAQGWVTLARSYRSMERFAEAAGAYAKATELTPNDAELWVEYSFVSAMANNRQMEGRPTELIEQALKIDPNNINALQIAGRAAYQAGDYAKAIEYWQRVLPTTQGDPDVSRMIQSQIEEAKSKLTPGPRK